MKLKYILPIALEVTRLEFSILRCKRMMRICEIAIIISTALLLLGLLSSCVLPKVTINGQYGEYSFTPRKAVIIETLKP